MSRFESPRVCELPGLCLGQPWVGQSGDGCISVACGDVCFARIKGDRGVADLDRDRLDGRLSAAQLCRCAVLACGDISALRSRARAGLTRSSRCASCEGSSRVAQRSPRRQSLRKILPPTSCHQTVGGFYYILFVDGPWAVDTKGIIRIIAHTLGPRHSCNHFYSSKLADASQFTSLGAGL